jgi:hypothetical protein
MNYSDKLIVENTCTRLENTDTSRQLMMSKFEKLNKEYNKLAEYGSLNNNINGDDESIFNVDDESFFNIMGKASAEIKNIKERNKNLRIKISEYEGHVDKCKEILNQFSNISKYYSNLSCLSQILDTCHKLDIKDNLFDPIHTINISNFMNDLKTNVENLEFEIKNNNDKLNKFYKLVRLSKNKNDNSNLYKINICNICYDNKIDTCLNPCGHTFCSNCVDKMYKQCGICRNEFSSKIKMFIEHEQDEDGDNNESDALNNDVIGTSGIQSFNSNINVSGISDNSAFSFFNNLLSIRR